MDNYVEKVKKELSKCINNYDISDKVIFFYDRLLYLSKIKEELKIEIESSNEYIMGYDDWSIEFIYKYWFTCEYLKEKISRTKMKLNHFIDIQTRNR